MIERNWLLVALSALVVVWAVWRALASTRSRALPFGTGLDLHRRALLQVGGAMLLLMAGLMYRLVYVSLIGARSVADKSGQDENGDTLSNARDIATRLDARRGSILDRNGNELVVSRESGDRWMRDLQFNDAPHLLGYFSPLRFGLSGLEASRDGDLSGADPLTFREAADALLFRRSAAGHNVITTIDSGLQSLAAELLSSTVGSVVVIEAKTGAIRAMASSPAFDSSALTTNDEGDYDQVGSAWDGINDDPNRPLLFRATTGLYPPGSTFKVLTAAAGIDSGAVTDSTVFTDDGSFEIEGRVIPEFNRPDETKTEWTVREGLVWSLNVVYAQIGLEIGSEQYRSYTGKFGIGRAIEFELDVAQGQIAADLADLDNRVALADTAFGQGALLVTPLHMARVMMAIANGGKSMRPQLVQSIQTVDGEEIWTMEAEDDLQPVSRQTADVVLDMLYDSVAYGYASNAGIPGLNVAGKTGTAESGRDAPHGWFIGSAGVDEPEMVVAVCLDYGGEGGGLPLQIGRALLDAAVTR